MTPFKTSFSLPDRTKDQLETLAVDLGMTRTQVLVVAIDRMAREELKGGKQTDPGKKP